MRPSALPDAAAVRRFIDETPPCQCGRANCSKRKVHRPDRSRTIWHRRGDRRCACGYVCVRAR
eukprot:gene4294-2443_t